MFDVTKPNTNPPTKCIIRPWGDPGEATQFYLKGILFLFKYIRVPCRLPNTENIPTHGFPYALNYSLTVIGLTDILIIN